MLTKPSVKNLSYHKLNNRWLDKQILRHDALSQEEIWRRDGSCEDKTSNTDKTFPNRLAASHRLR